MIVYKAQNKINGKIYIGKTIKTLKDRLSRHYFQPSGMIFHRALRKYGRDGFDYKVIDTATSDKELCEKEKYWIKFYCCKTPFGYNMTDGGDGMSGYVLSEEQRRKISEKSKGNKKFLGKRHTEETKKKCSLAKIGNTARLGMPHKESTKRLIGLANAGEKCAACKLSWEDVLEIRRRYSEEKISQQKLADEYGITIGTVSPLINHKTWKESCQI